MTEPKPPPAATALPPSLVRVAAHAVASGLTPLIPVPFLDDFALVQVREGMVRGLLEERGLPTPERAVEALAGSQEKGTLAGHLKSWLKGIALLPAKLVFRRLFIVLWIKDCVDVASVSLHHGYLLNRALERGHLDRDTLASNEAPQEVYDAIVKACAELDPRPVNQALRRLFSSSKLLMAEAARALLDPKKVEPRTPGAGEAAEVKSLADRLTAQLWEERGYFASLEQHFERHLKARRTGAASVDITPSRASG